MNWQTSIRHLLRGYNDGRAASRALTGGSVSPLVKRAGWRGWGKATGRIGGRWLR